MRHLVVTACACLLTCSTALTALAADQKSLTDSGPTDSTPVPSTELITAQPKTLPLDPGSIENKPAELVSATPGVKALSDRPIDIPPQTGFSDLLEPRDLKMPADVPETKQVARRSTKRIAQRSTADVCEVVSEAAESNNLPAPFFIRLLFQESRFKPNAVSHAGAQGIAQFMPGTARQMGLQNPFDPMQAIPAAAKLLGDLVDRFGNVGLAAAAYNAGPGRIKTWLAKGGSLPRETQGYVKIITGVPAEHWRGSKKVKTAHALPDQAPCQDVIVASAESDLPEPTAQTRSSATTAKIVAAKPAVRSRSRVAARKARTKVVVKASKARSKVAARKARTKTAAKASKARSKVAARKAHRSDRKRLAAR